MGWGGGVGRWEGEGELARGEVGCGEVGREVGKWGSG